MSYFWIPDVVVHGYLHLELLFLVLRHGSEHKGLDQGLAGSAHAHWQCCHLFLSPLLVGNVPVRPVFLLHTIHGCAEVGTLVHMIFGWLALPMVIHALLAVLADHTFQLLWYPVICEPPPHVADNTTTFQSFSSFINLINIGVLQGGLIVFCTLGWGEADVFIAFRGQDYDWLVVVESLFENQRNIDIVGVNKRSFAVHITQ